MDYFVQWWQRPRSSIAICQSLRTNCAGSSSTRGTSASRRSPANPLTAPPDADRALPGLAAPQTAITVAETALLCAPARARGRVQPGRHPARRRDSRPLTGRVHILGSEPQTCASRSCASEVDAHRDPAGVARRRLVRAVSSERLAAVHVRSSRSRCACPGRRGHVRRLLVDRVGEPSGKKSCPVWTTEPPRCTLTWMCTARPWYQPG